MAIFPMWYFMESYFDLDLPSTLQSGHYYLHLTDKEPGIQVSKELADGLTTSA